MPCVILIWINLPIIFFSLTTMARNIINTSYGPVGGYESELPTNKTAISYLGIPFAKAGRFEYPVPPAKWTSTLHANKTEKICPQPTADQAKLSLMSEDCLLLSVYAPGNATGTSTLAVMLWFHGGAFTVGDTLGYDGRILASEGNVIVVTAAYRLGVLGFLSTKSNDLRGNYGLLDQIEAMKWVNVNIKSFGGDPNKVTIFGGSAGSMCVGLLMLSPLASGLYQHTIMQSGSAAAISSAMERDEADLQARTFAKALGCTMNSLKACAKGKSVEEILEAQVKVFSQPTLLAFGPVVDGYFLPGPPVDLLQAGKFNKTNTIIGVARDDGSIFISGVPRVLKGVNVSRGMPRSLFEEEIKKRIWVRDQGSQIADLLIYEYTDWSKPSDPYVLRQQFMDLHSDSTFKAPAIHSADAFVKKEAPTYFYQLETAPKVFPAIPFPLPTWLGVYHRADVPFVFGDPLQMNKNLTTVAEIELSRNVMRMWTNFAKTGNPNTPIPLQSSWPQYTADGGEYIGLSPNLTVRSKMRPEKMALWNVYLPTLALTEPSTASSTPTEHGDSDGKDKGTLVTVLAVLTGVFVGLAVILLTVLIIIMRRKRRSRGEVFLKI